MTITESPDYAALRMTRAEYMFLVRLLGNHVCGPDIGQDRLYERLIALRPDTAKRAELLGPLVHEHRKHEFYGDRPMVDLRRAVHIDE